MGASSEPSRNGRLVDRRPTLALLVREVRTMGWGETTDFVDGHLSLSRQECDDIASAAGAARIRCSMAAPGERVRLLNILDIVEPRTKDVEGDGTAFPGFLGPRRVQGRGQTHVARGALVVLVGDVPRAQPAVADLSGELAEYSPLGGRHLLVLEIEPQEEGTWESATAAGRLAALRLAKRLAEAIVDAPPDDVAELLPPAGPSTPPDALPRVGVITNLQGQGPFKDVCFYGRTVAGLAPTLVDPCELEDGALVSLQYGHPALRNPTFLYQNHPVVSALRERDGRELAFAGLILSPEPEDMESKELVSTQAARLASMCGLDAAVVTKEGGGNADADLVLKLDELERLGIAAAGITPESAGRDGTGPPLVTVPTELTTLISAGNYDERVRFSEVDRVLGGERLRVLDGDPRGTFELPLAAVYCALNPLGWGRLAAQEVA